jgi:hypothetical protein
MNPKWLKSKGFIGGLGMLLTAVVMAGDNIFGDTRAHDWNEVIVTASAGLGMMGIRMAQGPKQ